MGKNLQIYLNLYYYYYYYYYYFHTSVSWWSFTGVWVTASLLRSPGFFWVVIFICEFFHTNNSWWLFIEVSDIKSSQESRTLLSIPANLNNVAVWMVSILPLISNSSSLSSKLLGTVPRAPTTIGITFTLIFQSFFSSLARSRYLSIFSLSNCLRIAHCVKPRVTVIPSTYIHIRSILDIEHHLNNTTQPDHHWPSEEPVTADYSRYIYIYIYWKGLEWKAMVKHVNLTFCIVFLFSHTHTQTYIYIYIYIHTHIYMYTHTHIYIYIYICIHTYMYTHTHICIHTHTHTHTYIYMYTHTYICIHTHIHTHTHIYIYTHTHTHTHTYIYIHTHTHTHTHIYIYTHTHTHTHIYIYTHTHTHIYIYIYIYIYI